jgi:hypothetical protein
VVLLLRETDATASAAPAISPFAIVGAGVILAARMAAAMDGATSASYSCASSVPTGFRDKGLGIRA